MRNDPVGCGLWMSGPQFRGQGDVSGDLGGVALLEGVRHGGGVSLRGVCTLSCASDFRWELLASSVDKAAMLSLPLWN